MYDFTGNLTTTPWDFFSSPNKASLPPQTNSNQTRLDEAALELIWKIFSYLDGADILQLTLVNKKLYAIVEAPMFQKFYAKQCGRKKINTVNPIQFAKFFQYFSPQQLFSLDGKKITRSFLQDFPSNESNQIKLAKFVTSVNSYKEILYMRPAEWCDINFVTKRKFLYCGSYAHLYILGCGPLNKNVNKTQDEILAAQRKLDPIMRNKKELEEFTKLEEIVGIDFADLLAADPQLPEEFLFTEFKRCKIEHIFNPISPYGYFRVPTLLFKSLFSALTVTQQEESLRIATKSPPSFLLRQLERTLDGLLWLLKPSAFDFIQIFVHNDEELNSLGQWLETSKKKIKELTLSTGRKVSREGLKVFSENLNNSNLKKFTYNSNLNTAVDNLGLEIATKFNAKAQV